MAKKSNPWNKSVICIIKVLINLSFQANNLGINKFTQNFLFLLNKKENTYKRLFNLAS